ncbi:hypothetical protein G7Y79_00014g037300 [Physcia stellaris]|nr:hypothetical protein G7Y79_00014g037300 [Physcia stellaris]
MAVLIASSIVATLTSFNELIEEIKAPNVQQVEGLSQRGWEDQLSRLRVWAANIGAHQTNQSSLDYRLRDASHIRNRIVELLESLLRRLDDARDVLIEHIDGHQEVISDSDDDEEQLNLKPEIEQMQDSAASIIGNLFQMSMLVRKPAKRDLTVGSRWSDVEHYSQFDCNHVRGKYPKADELLVERLAKGITQRRMYLKYRERHALKLKQGLSATHPEIHYNIEDDKTEDTNDWLSETVVTVPQSRSIDFDDTASDSDISQSSYAESLVSGSNTSVPPLPKEAGDNEPFECPFCYIIVKIDTTRTWNKHVFQDLQPYICIYGECTTPEKLYTSRREWISHVEKYHAEGAATESANQDRGMTDNRKSCPLCTVPSIQEGDLTKHIARHLEELALFALPRGGGDLHGEESEEGRGEAAELPVSHAFNEDSDGNKSNLEGRHTSFWEAEDQTESSEAARMDVGTKQIQSPNLDRVSFPKGITDVSVGSYGDNEVSILYEGWKFVKQSPRRANEKPSWGLAIRTRMTASQDELRRQVRKRLQRRRRRSVIELYSSPEMDGFKRKQVDRLITDRNSKEMDPRFIYELATLRLDLTTNSMQVILRRVLRKKFEQSLSIGQDLPSILEEEIVDLIDREDPESF